MDTGWQVPRLRIKGWDHGSTLATHAPLVQWGTRYGDDRCRWAAYTVQ
jgi:hypothetical protein